MSSEVTQDQCKDYSLIANILITALPFMQRYYRKFVVIKFGGHAIAKSVAIDNFAKDVVMLKQSGLFPIVVHGGGPQISEMAERLNIKTEFVDGLRITCDDTIKIVEMVLAGSLNKMIVGKINFFGGLALGITGKDANLVEAEVDSNYYFSCKQNKQVFLGNVGYPVRCAVAHMENLIRADFIPVIAPISCDKAGRTLSLNADVFAGFIASELQAKRLIIMTEVDAVRDVRGDYLSRLKISEAGQLIRDGVATDGMIPKLQTAISAVKNGVEGCVIINGARDHAIIRELFTDEGSGTLVVRDD